MLVSRPCRSMKSIRPRNHLPVGVRPFEHAVVREHDFAHLLIIALRQRIAAKRDDAPAAEARGRCLFVLHEYRPVIVWPCPRPRSEEHTSELQSLMRISYAVFCLKK